MTRKIKTILPYLLPVLLVLVFAVATIFIFRAVAHREDTPDEDEGITFIALDEPSEPTPEPEQPTFTEADLPADDVPQYEGANPNTSDVITGNIIKAEVKNDNVNIYVNLDQQLSSGVCTLTIGDFTTEAKVGQSGPSTSTCQGFSIPVSTLASRNIKSGKQTFTIKISAGTKTGTLKGEFEL